MDPKSQQIKEQVLEQLIEFMNNMDVDRLKGPEESESVPSEDKPVGDVVPEEESVIGEPKQDEQDGSDDPKQDEQDGSDNPALIAELEKLYGHIK